MKLLNPFYLMSSLVVALSAVLVFSCEKDLLKRQTGVGNAQRARLCADAGATFDPDNNECICANEQRWNGSACELTATSPEINTPSVPAAAINRLSAGEKSANEARPTKAGEASNDAATVAAAPTPSKPLEALAEGKSSNDGKRAREFCRQAKGRWIDGESYCFCPRGQVLVGRSCRVLRGDITDDACKRAAYPGTWRNGQCLCKDSKDIFSPARGGCAPRRDSTDVALRRICESSLNQGRWDAYEQRCRCPAGRVWHTERCLMQSRLTSQMVCGTDYNKGTWDAARKACDCPDGFFWIDQSCRQQRFVSAAEACRAERNRGRWDQARHVCLCPGLKRWRQASLSCEAPR